MAEITTLGAPIKTAYEGQPNTNAFTDAEKTKLAGFPDSFDKDTVGLGNVDNTSDMDKPISTATQSALDDKISDITGLVEEGLNVTITGIGTDSDPYVISSSGGGGGTDVWTAPPTLPSPDMKFLVASSSSSGDQSSNLRSIGNYIQGKSFNALDYGVKADGIAVTDVTTTSGSAVISSASRPFVSGDVGKFITVHNPADLLSNNMNGTILSVSSGSATLSTTAPWSVAGTAKATFGTNDIDALTSVNNACRDAGGGLIILPAGIMMIDESLTVYSRVSWKGQGQGNTVLKYCKADQMTTAVFVGLSANASNYYQNNYYGYFDVDCYGANINNYSTRFKAFFIQYMENPTFENLSLMGTPATSLGVDMLKNGCIITGNRFFDSGRRNVLPSGGGAAVGLGVEFSNENYIVSNNYIYHPKHYGVFVENQVSGGQVRCPTIISDNIIVMAADGFNAIGTCAIDGCMINDNHITGPGNLGSTCTGIVVQKGSFGSIEPGVRTQICDNFIRGMRQQGIKIDYSTNPPSVDADTIISGNSISECLYGIQLTGPTAASGINIGDYLISNNAIFRNRSFGLYLSIAASGTRNLNLIGNAIYNNTSAGIRLTGALNGARWISNSIYDDQTVKTQTHGISIHTGGSITNAFICNNDLAGNATSSISLTTAANPAITGYVFDNNIDAYNIPGQFIRCGRPPSKVEILTNGVASPFQLVSYHNGLTFVNTGATAKTYINLPTAVEGLEFTFIVQDADGLNVKASAGDTIRIAASVSAVAGNIDNVAIGSTVTLKAINAVEWIATSVNGTWTVT